MQHVAPVEGLRERRHGRHVGDVEGLRLRRAALRPRPGRGLVQPVRAPGGQDHVEAGAGQQRRGGRADAAARAGDNRDWPHVRLPVF